MLREVYPPGMSEAFREGTGHPLDNAGLRLASRRVDLSPRGVPGAAWGFSWRWEIFRAAMNEHRLRLASGVRR